MSDVSVVCYQIQISAAGRSLVQRNPVECGVYDRGTPAMRKLWPTGAVELYKKKRNRAYTVLIYVFET